MVTVEAESGTLGSDFSVVADSPTYITNAVNAGGESPGDATRVVSYTVTFPAAGTYDLYGRVRLGPIPGGGDSFFYGNGFGVKSPTSSADWIRCNGLDPGGFTNPGDVVAGSGSEGIDVWKWVNFSEHTGTYGEQPPVSFTVTAGDLTRTFQIGARENAFKTDKFAFGTDGTSFTVADLDNGTVPQPPTNAFPGSDGIAIHRFSPLGYGINLDGANPAAGLALSGGVLIGTTYDGGPQGAGTAFFLSLDGTNFSAFNSFGDEPDAGNPQGDLAVSGTGFFGTTFGGGNNGVGTVFFGQTNGSVSLIRSFAPVSQHNATNTGGASPSALLALSGNTLYGTTTCGGAAANGTVFSLTTNGATFSVLHNFSSLDSQTGTNTDGAVPWGGLILVGSTLYGTASAGGDGGNGVVFSVNTSGGDYTTLHSFAPMDPLTATNTDGAVPFGGLVLSNSTLFSTTFAGGQGGSGTVFSIGTNGTGFTVIHHFRARDSITATNTDGAAPSATLLLSSNVLYGTASAGGAGAAGTVFSLGLDGAQFNTLHDFTAVASNGTNRYGACPVAPVLRVGDSLYGTTFSGGPGAAGTVFSIPLQAPAAVITTILPNLDGSITLHFLGGSNSTNVIQAVTSLKLPAAWQNVSTNVAGGGGTWQYTDSNNTTTTRYYRSYAP